MRVSITKYFFFIAFVFFVKISFGQLKDEGLCFIKNYSANDFKSIPQNWAVAQDLRGVMFFGNTSGLLEFDGINWGFIDCQFILSLALDSSSGIVYAGSIGDFGYISPDAKGKNNYVSLKPLIPEKYRDFGEIWYTFSTNTAIFFISNTYIFKLENGKIRVWSSPDKLFHTAFKLGNKIFVKQRGKGIFQIGSQSLELVEGTQSLSDDRIYSILPVSPGEFLLATRSKGLIKMKSLAPLNSANSFSLDSGVILKDIKNEASEFLIKNEVYCGAKLKNGSYSFGTLNNGVLFLNNDLSAYSIVTKNYGLQDSKVHNVFQDKQENVWLALGNGISLIDYNSPFRYYNDMLGITGFIESVIKFKDNYYFAGAQGVFVKSQGVSKAEKVNNVFGESWTTYNFKNPENSNETILLIGNKSGLYKIVNKSAELLFGGSTVYSIFQSKRHPNELFLGLGDGLFRMKYQNGLWIEDDYIGDFEIPIRHIAEDIDGNIWAAPRNGGLYFIRRNVKSNTSKFEFVEYNSDNGWNDNETFIYTINGKLFFNGKSGLYKFQKTKSGFIFSKSYEYSFDKLSKNDMKGLVEDNNGNIWITSIATVNGKEKLDWAVIKKKENKKDYYFQNIPFKRVTNDVLVNGIFPENNGYTWYASNSGVIVYNSNFKSNTPYYNFNALIRNVCSGSDTLFGGSFISSVYSKHQNRKVNCFSLNQTSQTINEFNYKNNNLTFYCGSTSFLLANENLYSYFLEGNDKNWSPWDSKSEKVYTNLSEGDYVFKVRCINNFLKEGQIAEFKFTILPPWYRTIWAYLVYLILGIYAIVVIVKFYTKSLNRIIDSQTFELKKQKTQIEHKNKEITDSIYYAKRIQLAIMPSQDYILSMYKDSFIFFKPKDIVSGDFYWAGQKNGQNILAAVDCTGHGVPGAFMSLMGNENLNEIINEKGITQPNLILENLRNNIIRDLKQNVEGSSSKDGMDVSLCSYDPSTRILQFAGANNPIYIVRKKDKPDFAGIEISEFNDQYKLFEIKGNKFPVGVFLGNELPPFTNHTIEMLPGDSVYIFSDGFPDQFGGPKGKKFKYNQLKKVFLDNQGTSVKSNHDLLERILMEWQGDLEQVDDILIMGFRIV